MNKPRYSDHNGGNNSWHSNSNSRRSAQSTGRSNYGGSRRNHNRQGGNPIGNWINRRRQRRLEQQQSSSSSDRVAVGTERNAQLNMTKNAKHFSYPAEGFITPIEHSLLYAMIEFPERYPEAVVKNEIDEEEFDVYLYVNDTTKKGGGPPNTANGEEGEQNEGNDHATQSQSNKDDERVSYAQLSALLSLSSEKNPPVATSNQNESPEAASDRRSSTPMNLSSRKQSNNTSTNNTTAPDSKNAELSIGQTLCRKLLKSITRYCDTHNLDRQTEVAEFLNPIEKRCRMRNEKAALQQLLPAYAGYTLSLVTGNPLPLLIGAAALTGPDPMVEENSNVVGFRGRGNRVGDMETAGLLDECDSD